MNIWVKGKKYELGTMPNEILASCLLERIKIDYEDSLFPETTRKEGYALLNEAAKRLNKGCRSIAEERDK